MRFKVVEMLYEPPKEKVGAEKDSDAKNAGSIEPEQTEYPFLRYAMPLDEETDNLIRRFAFRTKDGCLRFLNPDDLPLGTVIEIRTP